MKKLSLILVCIILCTLFASCAGSAYTPGITTENGYESDWLGLEFIPTENMVMASANELEEMMGLTDEEKKNFDWSQVNEAYEMMATDKDSGDVVVVMAEKLSDKSMTVEQFVENLKKEVSGFEEYGITYDENKKVTIAGKKYTRFGYEISLGELSISQVYFIRKISDRMVVIMITSSNEGAEEMFLSCFKAK